ncbi:MAG: porin [Saprospiraceae bacterium]|jgi:hypothetical protein|nr:porin [Saprospiraceae bacterium]
MRSSFLFLFLLFPIIIFSQNESTSKWKKKLEDFKIEPILAIQLWSSYTNGMEVFDSEEGIYKEVDDRFNTEIRRTRLGIKGQPYEFLKFNFNAALDFVGRDLLTGPVGGANNGPSPSFRVWNAFVQWRISQKNESLNITVGYFAPQIGRESITAATRVPSMEKSWSQNYLRRHLVGTGPGRTAGINFGGLLGDISETVSFKYDLGIFNPVFHNYSGNSTGVKSSPLIVGRFLVNFGDPESKNYTLGHKVNYFGKRKGLSVAFAGTTQGDTDLFEKNHAAGMDFLLNWDNLNFGGEWTYMWRTGNDLNNQNFTVNSQTGFLRMSYNLNLKNGYVLEPALLLVKFRGETDAEAQSNSETVNSLSGKDQVLNFGFNFYFNPNLKLSLHYTLNDGDLGSAAEGAQINNFFAQSGVGAIRRGDWLGLGLVAVF